MPWVETLGGRQGSSKRLLSAPDRLSAFTLSALLVPLLLLAGIGWWLWAVERRSATEGVERMAAMMAEQARHMLETQETMLEAALLLASRAQSSEGLRDAGLHRLLAQLASSARASSAISIVDPTRARIVSTSSAFPPPDIDLSGRDYLQAARHGFHTYVGGVVVGAASGRRGFTVSRVDPQSGLVAVTLVPHGRLFSADGRDGARDGAFLMRSDGVSLVPDSPIPSGVATVLKEMLGGALPQSAISQSAADGSERLWSAARVGDYPVYAIYGIETAQLRANWRTSLTPFAALAFAGAFVFFLTARAAESAVAARHRAEAEAGVASLRAEQAEALHAKTQQLEALLVSAPIGLTYFDREHRYVEVNAALARMNGMSQSSHLGCRIEDLLPTIAGSVVPVIDRVFDSGVAVADVEVQGEVPGEPGETRSWLCGFYPVTAQRGETALVGAWVVDITERKRSEEAIRLLLREVNHRAKNLLGLVQAVARHTVASNGTEFASRFSERLQSLAASQDLLVKSEWTGVALAELVNAQLAHFKDLIGNRVQLDGPPVMVTAAAAQTIGMAVHELATNAGKYGALSNATGRIMMAWSLADGADGQVFRMTWDESGGPAVEKPARQGFGSIVISTIVRMGLSADVVVSYPESGLCWRLECPVQSVLDGWS